MGQSLSGRDELTDTRFGNFLTLSLYILETE